MQEPPPEETTSAPEAVPATPDADASSDGAASAIASEPASSEAASESDEAVAAPPSETDGAAPSTGPKKPRVPSLAPPTTFVRQLSEALLLELSTGPFQSLIGKLVQAGIDLHLREGSLLGWWGGTVLVTIARHPKGTLCLMLPRKSVKKVELPKHYALKGSQACWLVDDALLAALDREMRAIKEQTERGDTRDGPLEQKFMTSNPGSAGVIPLDRQVQVPNGRSRLDAVAVEKEGARRFLLVDLKNGASSELATAHVAAEQFYGAFSDGKGGLRQSYIDEYRAMIAQQTRLGIPSPDPDLLAAGMPVCCIVGLAHFRSESSLLSRLVDNAAKVKFPLYVVEFAGSDGRVPNQRLWTGLGASKAAPVERPFG